MKTKKNPTIAASVVAHHEAGHAVVAHCVGIRLRRATIKPDQNDRSAGHVLHYRMNESTRFAIEYADRFSRSRIQAEKYVMVSMAGELAQRRFNPSSVNPDHAFSDRETVIDTLARYAGASPVDGVSDISKYQSLLEEWTLQLLIQKWYLVEAVANALLERQTLSGIEVRDVITSAQDGHFNKIIVQHPPVNLKATTVSQSLQVTDRGR